MHRRAAVVLVFAVVVVSACQGSPHRGTSPATTETSPTSAGTVSTVPAPATSAPSPSTSPTSSPEPAGPALVVSRGRADRPLVALTFDAGSDAGNTATILDILAAHHIRATFGITGLWAQANPQLVQRMAASGQQLVNHSWDHASFTGASTGTTPLSAAQIGAQLGQTEDLIRRLTGAGTGGWFRPPYGDRSSDVDAAAGAAGYRYDLMWTVDTLGWKGVDPATVVERALAAAGPGEIILMHVGSQSTDAAALPSLISALSGRNLGFATVSGVL